MWTKGTRCFGRAVTTVRGGRGVSTASESNAQEASTEKLYPAHIPTSCLQKAILAVGSSVVGLMDPWRPDMVAVSGEVTGAFALRYMRATMADDPEGRKVLDQRPRINTRTVDMDALRRLPEQSIGHVYATYNDRYGITPDSRDTVRFVDDDPELAYVMQRYREVHDVTHALLGMPTNLVGEVAIKWVEALQYGLPMCAGAAVFGPLRFTPKQKSLFFGRVRPWAIRVGTQAHFLLSVFYEDRWEQSLDDFRREMNIEDPPYMSMMNPSIKKAEA